MDDGLGIPQKEKGKKEPGGDPEFSRKKPKSDEGRRPANECGQDPSAQDISLVHPGKPTNTPGEPWLVVVVWGVESAEDGPICQFPMAQGFSDI
jgi:hypothetical protein